MCTISYIVGVSESGIGPDSHNFWEALLRRAIHLTEKQADIIDANIIFSPLIGWKFSIVYCKIATNPLSSNECTGFYSILPISLSYFLKFIPIPSSFLNRCISQVVQPETQSLYSLHTWAMLYLLSPWYSFKYTYTFPRSKTVLVLPVLGNEQQ